MKFGTTFLFILCGFCFLIIAQSAFIAKKQPKKLSNGQLKEEIGQTLGHMLEVTAAQIKFLAQLQEEILKHMHELLEQDHESYFYKAKNQQLQESIEKVHMIAEHLDQRFQAHMHDVCVFKNVFTIPVPAASK